MPNHLCTVFRTDTFTHASSPAQLEDSYLSSAYPTLLAGRGDLNEILNPIRPKHRVCVYVCVLAPCKSNIQIQSFVCMCNLHTLFMAQAYVLLLRFLSLTLASSITSHSHPLPLSSRHLSSWVHVYSFTHTGNSNSKVIARCFVYPRKMTFFDPHHSPPVCVSYYSVGPRGLSLCHYLVNKVIYSDPRSISPFRFTWQCHHFSYGI